MNLLLWGMFVFLFIITIGACLYCTDCYFAENFGSSCLDFLPFKEPKRVPIKPNTIFVSVASYRDPECSDTIHSLFENAHNPNNVFVGICEQNNPNEPREECSVPTEYESNIRVMTLNYRQAKGPTFARYYCSDLWDGEEYYLQIDSHTTFMKNWDIDLINMIKAIKADPNESNYPVLSAFPPKKDQMSSKGFPEMNNAKFGHNGLPMIYSGWAEETPKPPRANKPWAGAGFMFLESKFLQEVPFDPNLSHLFQGEEILFSARLFTNGYDFYVPNKKIAYHHYGRSGPMFYKDNLDSGDCRSKAEARVKFLLGLESQRSVTSEFLKDIHNYGLGKYRSINDFWNTSGVDIYKKTVEKWDDRNLPSAKYAGWWFRQNGFKKIRKRN